MTNDLAIRILNGDILGTTEQTHEAVAMAVKALSARTDTDTVSRQDAIDALHGYFDGMLETDTWSPCDVYGLIEILPSAQPEIIYCKKCEHWTRTYGDEQWGLGDCDVFDKHLVRCNGYCAWAERRTDGPDRQTGGD